MTEQEHEIRDQIVELMKVRASLTAKSNAKEWRRVDRKIIALQRKRDRIRANCN